jgi:hypothetical protein
VTYIFSIFRKKSSGTIVRPYFDFWWRAGVVAGQRGGLVGAWWGNIFGFYQNFFLK